MATEPKLVDLAYTKADLKRQAKPGGDYKPDPYPWGLCLHLEKEQLDQLGISTMPEVGAEVHMVCVAKVTSVNHSAREGQDENASVGLQITMAQVILSESAASEKGEKSTPASEAKETKGTLLSAR